MSGNFIIRRADANDYDAVHDLMTAEFIDAGYSQEALNDLAGTAHHPAVAAKETLKRNLEQPDKSACWLAIADDKPIGIITTKDLSGGVFVDPAYQRRGIASALAETRLDFQRGSGQKTAEAHIEATNHGSIKLHQKLGFEFDQQSKAILQDREENGIPANEEKPPVLVMTINLNP